MQTRFPRSFFALQLTFAQRLAKRFSLPLVDILFLYTTFSKSLNAEDDWETYSRLLSTSDNPLELTYQLYLDRRGHERLAQPDDLTFHDRPLFGCFYYVVRDATIIRPHFLNNDYPGRRPLSLAHLSARRDELRRMFGHICMAVPSASTVLGNSWLYNLSAYIRLYPPSYTAEMEENTDGEFQMLARWAQCFDRFWEVKPQVAEHLLQRVEQLADLADLRFCFPYQLLQPSAPITEFYSFYDIAT